MSSPQPSLNSLQAKIGAQWDANSRHTRERGQWFNSETLSAYVRRAISPETGRGVPGALERVLEKQNGGRPLGRGISVGAGNGWKEMTLVKAGLVEHFALFEFSEHLAGAARRLAVEHGLENRITVTIGDAFAADHEPCDIVYWDHALHHMLDVHAALRWSLAVLRPGGFLLINDYIGPTRLQWTWRETRLAQDVVKAAEPHLGARPWIRPRTPFDRWRLKRLDPSEASQSDRILDACREACNGWAPAPIGCALINICGPYIVPLTQEGNPALDLLIARDLEAKAAGYSHFAFGIWRKPG